MARARGGRVSQIINRKPSRLRAYSPPPTLTDKILDWFYRKIGEAEREKADLLRKMGKI